MSIIVSVNMNGLSAGVKRKRTTIVIDGTDASAGVVRPEFLSFTLDWWPDDEPGWEGSSILKLDLASPRIVNAASSLAPFFLRVGGWEADRVVYLTDNAMRWQIQYCHDNPDYCLTMTKWTEIQTFAQRVGARIVFCLAYLVYIEDETRDWDGSNARSFLEHVAKTSTPGLLYGLELGNEPLHRGRSTNATRHVMAYLELRDMIDEIWSGNLEPFRPKLMGPATTGVNQKSFGKFLSFEEFCDAMDVATYHDYRCGSGRNENLSLEAIDPKSFREHTKLHHAAKLVEAALTRPQKEIWIGEGSMAYNSGRETVTDSLQSSFWYANILGQLAASRYMTHSVFCRQSLIGGWYDLLSHSNNFDPNPDYWLAVLWKQLVGTTSLFSERVGCCEEGSSRLLVHAFCACHGKASKYDVIEGDVVVVLINIADDTSYEVTLDETSDVWDAESRLEFLFEADHEELNEASSPLSSRRITINSQPVMLDPNGELPEFLPYEKHDADSGMILPPYSIMFAVLRGAKASLCLNDTSMGKTEIGIALEGGSKASNNDLVDEVELPKLHMRSTTKLFESTHVVTSLTASNSNGPMIAEFCFVTTSICLVVVGIFLVAFPRLTSRRRRMRVICRK
jgi:heparanase 1